MGQGTSVDPSTGSYAWTVGQHSGGTASSGTGYTVKVKEIGAAVSDTSDTSFEISSSAPSITVTSPNGGENWGLGSTENITWTSSGLSANIKITLWQGGSWVGRIATDVDPSTGSFAWTVGQHSGGTASSGTGYIVKIKEIGVAVSDTSDAEFSIIPWSPQITVTYPNGGETFYAGLWQETTWTCPTSIANVKIEYSIDNGVTWSGIITSTVNDGHHKFIVPESPSETCLMRVSDTDGDSSDVSDAVFTIEPDIYKCGKGGFTYERNPDGSIGPKIPWVEITFVSEDGSFTRRTVTNGSGYYRIPLPPQRYVVTAAHPDFHPYSTAPGFSVVTGDGYQTFNIFLTRK